MPLAGARRERRTAAPLIGLLGCCAVAFLFLPLFAQRTEAAVHAVSLLALTAPTPYVSAAYTSLIMGLYCLGVLSLALQSRCRVR